MNSNSLKTRGVVIVGGGFGGLTTALALSSRRVRPPIILIEPRKRFVFQPLLYELLSGELEAWEVAPLYTTLIASRGIVLIQELVEKVDLQREVLLMSSGKEIHYEQLVLGTGSKPNDYEIDGVREHSLMFSKYEDVSKLKSLLFTLNNSETEQQNLVIIGAGSSGVELACKVSDLLKDKIRIHLIELGERVLPNGKSFNQEQIENALKQRSINLHLNTRVIKIDKKNVKLQRLTLGSIDEWSLSHAGVIWTAGVQASLPFGFSDSLLNNGQLLIDSRLRVKGYENVFSIGDVSVDLKNPLSATAQLAMQQGKYLGDNLIAMNEGQAVTPFHFVDRGEMLSVGLGNASITGMGLTISGKIAFRMRLIAYFSKFPTLSLGLKSAGAWLINKRKKLI